MSSSSHQAHRPDGSRGRTTRWDEGIPPMLRPLVRAYLLGYVSSVAPRLLTLLLQHLTRRKLKRQAQEPATTPAGAQPQKNGEPFLEALQRILRGGLDWQRFPTFCAVLVGGSTLLERPFSVVFSQLANNLSEIARRRLSRWCASFTAAWLSLRLLQSKQTPSFTDTLPSANGTPPKTIHYAGRTLDLTFFAVTRALDVIGGELWHRRRLRRRRQVPQNPGWSSLESAVSRLTDPAIFALSSGLIMWTWIYLPSRLPRAYNKWIGSAAAVDGRLIEALRLCRTGKLRYGLDTGCANLLGSMCADYGWPEEWGNPAKSVPFPCEMVHMGCGPSCEYHAVSRFARSFRWAMATYLPLSLLLALGRSSDHRRLPAGLRRALLSAARSSAFLATFIALFYYGVCLARTRVGPSVLGKDAAAREKIDGGYCIACGCLLCGWSILFEHPGRRKDLALFVAPRALATLFPRRYALDKQWRETLVFAASTALVFTCVRENRARVRGVFGSVLGSVLQA